MKRDPLMANEDEVADYKWVNAEEFAASVKHNMSYLRALSTLFPSCILAKNSFEYTERKDSQKTRSKTEVQAQLS